MRPQAPTRSSAALRTRCCARHSCDARELVMQPRPSATHRARLHRCDRPRRHRGGASPPSCSRRDATVEVIRVVGPDTDIDADARSPARAPARRAAGLADALAGATVYVGAAGTTAVQAACVGIPPVITAVVPNQVAQAAALADGGCAVVADAAGLAARVSATARRSGSLRADGGSGSGPRRRTGRGAGRRSRAHARRGHGPPDDHASR